VHLGRILRGDVGSAHPPPWRLRLFVVETLSYEFSSKAVDGSDRGIVLTGR